MSVHTHPIHDCVVVGGGIVGLAVAMKLAHSKSRCSVAVLEKEREFGAHQTGHNSGVIHSGIYYRPGSLKARLCFEGAGQLIRFCVEHDIPHRMCGKIVVASEPGEIPFLQELHRRGTANGIEGLRLISSEEVREHEPHVKCVAGMHVPTTGIVDFQRVARTCARVFERSGGTLISGCEVKAIRSDGETIRIQTSVGNVKSRFLVNCSGLHADRVARLAGVNPPCRIVPFRGEYYEIRPSRAHLVRTLVYPVPDPRFPFLGVHFTRMINGKVEAGPNAVFSLAREGYTRSTFSAVDTFESLSYPGFWRLAARFWKPGFEEVRRSYSKKLFHRALTKLIPMVEIDDLIPGGAGVRAQALQKDGALLDDFLILPHGRSIHVLNAPSPAATSSLAIADHILRESLSHFP
jgi:L-2-hydroxyglutarate oxidase LhgO